MGNTTNQLKANKKIILFAFVIGALILFLVNNWTSQEAYDVISCTYNTNDCEDLEWDGNCTGDVVDECCTPVDMCDSQLVTNADDCLHYYCTTTNKFCKPVYDELDGTGKYKCTCSYIEEQA